MSSAIAAVRFADGEILYGVFHGTSDIMGPALSATPEEAWERRRDWPEPADVEVPEVAVLWITYGGGFGWHVRATRQRIVGPLDYMELPAGEEIREEPAWSPWREV